MRAPHSEKWTEYNDVNLKLNETYTWLNRHDPNESNIVNNDFKKVVSLYFL